MTMALVQTSTSASFMCGGCGRLEQAVWGSQQLARHPQRILVPQLVVKADSRRSHNGSIGDTSGLRKEARFTPRASPVLEELRLMSDAAAEAEAAKKGDWFSGLMKKLPGKQNMRPVRKNITGLEEPIKELFDYANEHNPLEDIAKSSTIHGKQVHRTREEAPCGEYLFDLEPRNEQAGSGGNGKVRRDPNILPSQWDQELKRSTPPGSPAKVGGGLKDSLSKEQMLALAGASMVGEGDSPASRKSGQGNGGDKRNVVLQGVQQVTSTIEQWAENVRK